MSHSFPSSRPVAGDSPDAHLTPLIVPDPRLVNERQPRHWAGSRLDGEGDDPLKVSAFDHDSPAAHAVELEENSPFVSRSIEVAFEVFPYSEWFTM